MNGYTRTAHRSNYTTGASDGSRTLTIHDVPTPEGDDSGAGPSSHSHRPADGVLRLRGARGDGNSRRVVWTDDTVDNEGMGKKKSKICCIYHKPKAFDESSSEGSSSSGDSDSDSDSDSASSSPPSDNDGPSMSRAMQAKKAKQKAKPRRGDDDHQCQDHDHSHSHSSRSQRTRRSGRTVTVTQEETQTEADNGSGAGPEQSPGNESKPRPNAYERGIA